MKLARRAARSLAAISRLLSVNSRLSNQPARPARRSVPAPSRSGASMSASSGSSTSTRSRRPATSTTAAAGRVESPPARVAPSDDSRIVALLGARRRASARRLSTATPLERYRTTSPLGSRMASLTEKPGPPPNTRLMGSDTTGSPDARLRRGATTHGIAREVEADDPPGVTVTGEHIDHHEVLRASISAREPPCAIGVEDLDTARARSRPGPPRAPVPRGPVRRMSSPAARRSRRL